MLRIKKKTARLLYQLAYRRFEDTQGLADRLLYEALQRLKQEMDSGRSRRNEQVTS